MSVLRKKYFSIQSQTFVDVPTTALNTFSSLDVGTNQNEETVRLIKFGDNVDSSRLDETFIDLLHNDKKLFDEYQKINSLISNGSFYNVGENFKIYEVKMGESNLADYIKSFGVKSGQIKYNDEIIFLESTSFYTTAKNTVSNGNIISVNLSSTDIQNNFINVGTIVFGSEFTQGTQVVGITGTDIELSLDLKENKTLASGSLILFMNIPTFEVGKEISEIGNYDKYPVYRRDLISYDIKKSSWEILKGTEVIESIPPINTQLDVIYQIQSITYINGYIHQVRVKKNNRNISQDLIPGEFLTLVKTDNGTFDGVFKIVSVDSVNYTVNIEIPLYRDGSNNIDPIIGGYIDLKIVGILSILVYKGQNDFQSLIIDSISNITSIAGITGGLQQILEAPIDHLNSYFSIKTNDFIHLVDIKGRLLDWEDGQGKITDPIIGYAYNEDDSNPNYLHIYDETNIPHPEHADITHGNLTNIPFILTNIENNVFGLKFVDLTSFNIGIKNTPASIGKEGITYKVSTYPQISDELSVLNVTSSIQDNQKITTINDINIFFQRDYQITPNSDFILITSGSGSLQIGKIISVEEHTLNVVGLYKNLDTTSIFIIFKNDIQDVINGENVIKSDSIKSQVLSGVNGTFGNQNGYSKVQLSYPDLNDIETPRELPKLDVSKWYFLSLKGYNDINFPQEQGTPFITTESLNSEFNDSSSSFVEVYYRTVSGKYPGDNFKILDEFGDISIQANARIEAPHFRPAKYQVIARSLDEKINYPQDLDEVFVDVHIGMFKFHPESIPRRVFVSYFKYDVIDGNSTDFSIKHIDVNGISKINLQDKISDLDYKFTQENEIQKTWKINGLISDENLGFNGPFGVDINDSYNVIYKYPDFTNFSFDEEKYVIKFSNHLYDTPIYVGKNNILLENISLEQNLEAENNFSDGLLFPNFSFLDSNKNVLSSSGVNFFNRVSTLPFIGINFYDESFLPTNDGFFSSISEFYRKKLIFETPSDKSEMSIDSGLYNLDYSINSKWNYLYSAPFEKNMVLYGLLRKNNYEFISNINCNLEIKRRIKQREFIRILDKNLNDLNGNKSTTKIISEKYLTKSLILDSTRYKENLLYLKAESVKYKPYEFLRAQNLQGTTLNFNNVNYPLTGFSGNSIKKDTIFLNNSSITAYISPNGSIPTLKIITFSKSEETSDIGTQSSIINDVIIDDVVCSEIKICTFNDNYFAVAYVTLLQLTEGNNYYIKIKLFSFDRINVTELPDSEAIIAKGFPILSPFIFNINSIGLDRIGIVFQRSITEVALITYYYYPIQVSPRTLQSNIKIIDSENTLSSYPAICKFSTNLFLVAYSNIYGSKIKIFDQEGKLQFFDNNQTVDFKTITNNNIVITGNIIDAIELDNNDIAIVFLDKDLFETYSLKLIILDHWEKTWKYSLDGANTSKTLPSPIYIEDNLSDKIESISLTVLNEDIFIVSYVKLGKIILKAFFNDGAELFNSFEDSITSVNSLILNTVGQSTIIATYLTTGHKYSVYNFRPDFTKNIIQNTKFDTELSYSPNYFFKNYLLDNNNFILLSQTSSNGYTIKIISTINKLVNEFNSSYNSLDFTLTGVNPKILNTLFLNRSDLKILFVLWSNNDSIFLEFFKFGSSITKSTNNISITQTQQVQYSKNFGSLINISNNILGIILLTNSNKYNIHGVNYQILETNNNIGDIDVTKYTSENYYNPTLNSLSGVNSNYDIIFYKRNNAGFLINSSNNNTNLNLINFNSNLFSGNTIDFTNLITSNYSTPLISQRQYSKINFIQDKFDENNFFVVGNSSGSLHYFNINFTVNENNVFNGFISSSGTYYIASGTNNRILDEPQVFTSSYDDGLILFYSNLSGSLNYHNVSFIDKNNNSIVDSSPKTIFNESSLGDKFFIQKSQFVDDFYSLFVTENKLNSKTLTLPYTDNIEYERLLKVKEKTFNISNGNLIDVNRSRLHSNHSIKTGGINWKGLIVKNFPVYSIDSFNLDSSQIDQDGIFKSEILFISAHLLSVTKDAFTIIYYYQKSKSSELTRRLRNFIISRGRVFPSSKWYDNKEISFEEQNINQSNIYLQSVLINNSQILNVWVNPKDNKIYKNLVDNNNISIPKSSGIIPQPSNSNWILLGSSILIEGWSTVLGYEKISNKFYTMLFNPQGELYKIGVPFNNLPFDIRTDVTSEVSISKFGYFNWLYIDSNSNLRYYQHGFDGDPWGISQIVGRNYITNIQTSSNSPIFNEVKDDILKTEDIKFLQYNRIDIELLNNNAIDMFNVYGIQETGLYRIFNLDDPTLNLTMGLKISTGEPTVSIDTSSSDVTNVAGTNSKFNIYISSSTNYVTFQNLTGNTLKLRFYKEK